MARAREGHTAPKPSDAARALRRPEWDTAVMTRPDHAPGSGVPFRPDDGHQRDVVGKQGSLLLRWHGSRAVGGSPVSGRPVFLCQEETMRGPGAGRAAGLGPACSCRSRPAPAGRTRAAWTGSLDAKRTSTCSAANPGITTSTVIRVKTGSSLHSQQIPVATHRKGNLRRMIGWGPRGFRRDQRPKEWHFARTATLF